MEALTCAGGLHLGRPLPNLAANGCTTRSKHEWEAALDGTKQAALRGIIANPVGMIRCPKEHTSSVPCLRLDHCSLKHADGGNRPNPPFPSGP